MADYPIDEVLANIEKQAAQGFLCFVKYTCEGCGNRNTATDPNVFHPEGYICQTCHHLTIPKGINFLLVGGSDEAKESMRRFMEGK